MTEMHLSDRIAEACYRKYASLPRSCKPGPGEWTLMSAVVQCNDASLKVVAMGTGSKCVGRNETSRTGDVLNDSHAETIARRAFLRYLYRCIDETRDGTSDVLEIVEGKRVLREDVSFHFYTSHTPCGDASIFPKTNDSRHFQDECREVESDFAVSQSDDSASDLSNLDLLAEDMSKSEVSCKTLLKRKRDTLIETPDEKRYKSFQHISESELETKKQNLVDGRNLKVEDKGTADKMAALEECETPVKIKPDIHRTGAKCVPSAVQDPHAPGVGYHVTGVLRTKPGRGDPTLSLSCSDKMARWNVMGCQGALLSLLISTPILFRSIVVGGGCPFSSTALRRALIDRVQSCLHTAPLIVQSSLEFPDRRTSDTSKRLCAVSLVWCDVQERPLEISVKGRKQGVTKKTLATPSGRLTICRKELGSRFIAADGRENLRHLTYRQVKELAEEYQSRWRVVKKACFETWPTKPTEMTEFRIND